MSRLSVGRRVHFVINGECKAADVTGFSSEGTLPDLIVLTNEDDITHKVFRNTLLDENRSEHSYHWPEREGE